MGKKPGYGEYKRGTGCYSKQMLKKDRRLGGHGDHSKSDHKGSDHSKDAKKDDHKEDDYCMKYDKYADKCNADDKCYFYTAKDGDKDKTDDKKPGYGDKKDEHKDDKKDEHKDDEKDEHKDDKKDEHKDDKTHEHKDDKKDEHTDKTHEKKPPV